MKEQFMREAIRLSIDNVKKGGGPFAAVIADNEKIIAVGVNAVIRNNDPTAHAEMQALRNACQALGTFDLSGYSLYSSCEPCPMCLGAIYWAHLEKVYYGNSRSDADASGFADAEIYHEFALPFGKRKIPFIRMNADEAKEAFCLWQQWDKKIQY